MKKLFLIPAIIIIILAFVGCKPKKGGTGNDLIIGVETSGQQIAVKDRRTIALVMKTLTNPFFIEMEKGARQAEQEFDIKLIVKTGAKETSIEQQIDIVHDLINDKVDAVVIAPASSVELIPVLKSAQDAGIVIVNIDNLIDRDRAAEVGLETIPFISVNNEEGAYKSASYISKQITTPTKLIMLEGIRSAINAEDRKNGALRAFKENPNIKIVAREAANWKIDEAYEVTKKLFDTHPDIEAIFCANDMMALGSIQFLKQTGRTDVLVAAYDNLEEAREAILKGYLQVTIDQQAARQGYIGVKSAIDILDQKKVSAEVLVDVEIITKESLEE